MSKTRHYTTTGCFYLEKNEKQQQVVLVTGAGTVSALWDEGEAPYDEGMLPSEVAQILRERINWYWIKTDRTELLKTLDAIAANANEIDREYLMNRADEFDKKAQQLIERAAEFRKDAEQIGPTHAEVEATMHELGFPSLKQET